MYVLTHCITRKLKYVAIIILENQEKKVSKPLRPHHERSKSETEAQPSEIIRNAAEKYGEGFSLSNFLFFSNSPFSIFYNFFFYPLYFSFFHFYCICIFFLVVLFFARSFIYFSRATSLSSVYNFVNQLLQFSNNFPKLLSAILYKQCILLTVLIQKILFLKKPGVILLSL